MIKQITAAVLMAATSFAAAAAEPAGFYLGADAGVTRVNDFSNDNSYGVFAGFKFNENVAIEAGYRELGRFGYGGYFATVKQTAISALGAIPMGKVSLYGRLGFNTLDATSGNRSADDDGLLAGVGVSYAFTKQISARVEYQHPSSDAKNLSVGLSYQF
jgi:opacity protein-like surface antigen